MKDNDLQLAIDLGIEEGDIVSQWCSCGCKEPITTGEVITRKVDGKEIVCIRNYERHEDTALNAYDEKGNLCKITIVKKK